MRENAQRFSVNPMRVIDHDRQWTFVCDRANQFLNGDRALNEVEIVRASAHVPGWIERCDTRIDCEERRHDLLGNSARARQMGERFDQACEKGEWNGAITHI